MGIKETTARALEQGRKDRAEYSPQEGSAPLRMYKEWAKRRPRSVPERENFCHYWRVVLFWGPLAVVADSVSNRLDSDKKKIVSVLLLILIFIAVCSAVYGLKVIALSTGITLGIMYLMASLIIGSLYGMNPSEYKKGLGGYAPLYLTLPISFVPFGITRFSKWYTKSEARVTFIEKFAWAVFILLLLGAVIALGFAIFLAPWIILMCLGIILGSAFLIIGLSFFGSFLKERHESSKASRTEWVEDEFDGYTIKRPLVRPSRVGSFFIAIGDFLNLIFQAVRVKKWKICPLVKVPNDAR